MNFFNRLFGGLKRRGLPRCVVCGRPAHQRELVWGVATYRCWRHPFRSLDGELLPGNDSLPVNESTAWVDDPPPNDGNVLSQSGGHTCD
jgi:hypothetical protein